MDENRFAFGVERMCRVMRVSRSGYYDWRKRGPSPKTRPRGQQLRHQRLTEEIKRVFEGSRKTYGSPRVFKLLKAQGQDCGRHLVERLMKQNGIAPRRRRKFKKTTDSNHRYPVAPNLVKRVFEAEFLNCLWTSDITYVPTSEGWLYLAVILDVCSRRIVGWGMSGRLLDDLVTSAVKQAIGRRRVRISPKFPTPIIPPRSRLNLT